MPVVFPEVFSANEKISTFKQKLKFWRTVNLIASQYLKDFSDEFGSDINDIFDTV